MKYLNILIIINFFLITTPLHYPNPFRTANRIQAQNIVNNWTKQAQKEDLPLFWLSSLHMANFALNQRNDNIHGLLWNRKYLYKGVKYDFNPYMAIIEILNKTSEIVIIGIIENPENRKHNNSCTWMAKDLYDFADLYNDTITFERLNSPYNKRWFMLLNYDNYFSKIDDYVYNITNIKHN